MLNPRFVCGTLLCGILLYATLALCIVTVICLTSHVLDLYTHLIPVDLLDEELIDYFYLFVSY